MTAAALHLDFVFPRLKALSGAERLVLELTAALARAGHHPRIVCHQFDASCAPLLADGVELVESGARLDWFPNRYANAAFDYARATGLRRYLKPAADAVILYGPALRLAPGLRSSGRAVVYHCFEPPRALYQDRDAVLQRSGALRLLLAPALSLYRSIDQRLVQRPGALMASGPYAAERVRQVYGRTAIPVTHGVDREGLDATHDAAGGLAPTTLVTVNYLHPRKRVDLAIRALARLERPLAGETDLPTLRVAGTGPEIGALRHLVGELGLGERVTFAGFVPETALGACYRASRCYLHTALEESFGLSVIEAAYCGLPVVAVREGGVVDNVIEGQTGALVEPEPDAVAAGLSSVLAEESTAAAMGAAGRRMVEERYTWEQGAEDLLSAVRAAQ